MVFQYTYRAESRRRDSRTNREVTRKNQKKKPQIPPLRYPGFPVRLGGVGELHAAFLTERRTRENAFCPATALHGSVALPFVIPSAAEGSAVPRTFAGNVF